MKIKFATFIAAILLLSQTNAQGLSEMADQFMNTLSLELKSKTLFDLDDQERFNMNFVPIERRGPAFYDFNNPSSKAAIALLRSSISREGFRKTTDIMELEKVLAIIENNNARMANGRPYRDPENYHFCIFGDPSPEGFWGWRFEGHHISLNFTMNGEKIISSTPSFFGSNPGIVRIDEQKGKEVLKRETDLGFLLVNSFTEDQIKTVHYAEKAPREIFTSNNRKAEIIKPKGLAASSFTEQQLKIFMELLNTYIDNYEFGFASEFRDKITKAGIENLYFAWAGSLSPGKGHYYRIQGPMLIIEYDNIQNNANHVHTVVRDLTNDYAEDLLKRHYESEHKN